MKILKSLALVAGLAIMAAHISAQEKQGPDPQAIAQRQTNQIKQNVTGITPDQESKILAVEQAFVKSLIDAKASSNGDREAMRAKMEPALQERDAKIKAILNACQNAQYGKYIAEHQQVGHQGGGNQ